MRKSIFILLLLTNLNLFSQDDAFFFEEDSTEVEDSSIPLQVDGSIRTFGNFGIDYDDPLDAEKAVYSDIDVNFLWELEYLDLAMNIDLDFDDWDNISDFPLQGERFDTTLYFDTLFVRFYHSRFDLEFGLLKPVWGNADAIHVIDVLNPLDYTEPFGTSYLERKISQLMLKFNIPIGDNSLLEAVYLPTFEGNNISMSGIWEPYNIRNIEEQIYQISAGQNPSVPEGILRDQASTIANSISVEEFDYFVDSQAAIRYSTSVNSVDIGATYYWGYLKEPTIDMDKMMESGSLNLIYNRVQILGLDLATQLMRFNLKGEFSLNLTEDIEGDDASVVNSSINYIVGFDINLPINNINFLMQGVGSGILNSDEITPVDPGYRDDEYIDFTIMFRLSDNYINETLYFEVAGAYDLFNNDFMLTPESVYKISDNLDLFIEYLILHGKKDTDFGQYRNNDRIRIGFEYFY